MLKGTISDYHVGTRVAENDRYVVHLCTPADDARKGLLLVAAQEGQNAVVDLWAFMLKELAEHAERLEAEYATVKTDPNNFLNYQLGFPLLVETFKSPKQRQVMIVAFEHSEPSAMVPIVRMIQRDKLRVDLKTSVWMMGKLLKILSFVHNQDISVGLIDTGTVLIDPDQHYVNVFDWSAAQIRSPLTDELKAKEVAQAANAIIEALDGNAVNRMIPNNEGEEGERYCAHLWTLADGLFYDATVAHKQFYELVHSFWERKFHPFTTFNRTGDSRG